MMEKNEFIIGEYEIIPEKLKLVLKTENEEGYKELLQIKFIDSLINVSIKDGGFNFTFKYNRIFMNFLLCHSDFQRSTTFRHLDFNLIVEFIDITILDRYYLRSEILHSPTFYISSIERDGTIETQVR